MDKLLDLTRDFDAAKAAFEAYLDEYDSCLLYTSIGNQSLTGILLKQFHKVVFAVIRESSELCCGQWL